jgi:osmotically-inducible protein OsmY
MMNKKMMFAFVPVVAIALWGCPSGSTDTAITPPDPTKVVSAVKDTAAAGAGAVKDAGAAGAGAIKDGAAAGAGAMKDAATGLAGNALAGAVNTALAANKDLAGIKVRVDDKGVYLTGTVANNDLKTKAGTAAQTALTTAKSPLKLMNQLLIK